MLSKKSIIYLLLTIATAIYAVAATHCARSMAAEAPCSGLAVEIDRSDPACSDFVNETDIADEINSLGLGIGASTTASVPLQRLETFLNSLPNVESANVARRSDEKILVEVTPMIPVARIFDASGSYYLNRDGKRLTASSRYLADVPPVTSFHCDSLPSPAVLLNVVRQIEANPSYSSLATAFDIAPNGDIIMIPSLTGHVVNLGDDSAIDDKFRRLSAFYSQVMTVKGWNHYDTVSVKFAGQVIASTAPGHRKTDENPYTDDDFDPETAESTAPDTPPDDLIARPTVD